LIDLCSFPTRRSSDLLDLWTDHYRVLVTYDKTINAAFQSYFFQDRIYSVMKKYFPNEVYWIETNLKTNTYTSKLISFDIGCVIADRKSTRLNSSHHII